jgi:nicotinate-nucleotide adenylyltransferase
MQFLQRADGIVTRLGILPGTFNPVTVAHLAVAQAGLRAVDEVVFVLPRAFPHKAYTGASFEERLDMLQSVLPRESQFSIATSQSGLFKDIAAEYRSAFGSETQLTFLCGRDAAERIATWDYDEPRAFHSMLRHFNLLVAARHGEYEVPDELHAAVARLELRGPYDHVSSSEVRDRIRQGREWEQLVPPAIHEKVRKIYG